MYRINSHSTPKDKLVVLLSLCLCFLLVLLAVTAPLSANSVSFPPASRPFSLSLACAPTQQLVGEEGTKNRERQPTAAPCRPCCQVSVLTKHKLYFGVENTTATIEMQDRDNNNMPDFFPAHINGLLAAKEKDWWGVAHMTLYFWGVRRGCWPPTPTYRGTPTIVLSFLGPGHGETSTILQKVTPCADVPKTGWKIPYTGYPEKHLLMGGRSRLWTAAP
ncbi:hypothetical protein KQX54_001335 [Cotesia glomerata]|uniref:Uncharacterized protein n=1 Tax=Cotesia glomerata TaxID=32391 RepID=A0AAV7IPD8_COTGL|nr:hypothetical protein KQX54_001335 [Cotesia glomerata]